jgi:hypothetical protein
VRLVATFEDGEALFAAARGLEGVVGKRVRRPLPAGRAPMGEGEEPGDRSFRGRT